MLDSVLFAGKKSPMITCHHRKLDDFGEEKPGEVCGGRTELRVSSEKQNARRRGELQTIRIDNLLEDARISLESIESLRK